MKLLCIDCNHYEPVVLRLSSKCRREITIKYEQCLVTGDVKALEFGKVLCPYEERRSRIKGACGEGARYWEAK